MISDGYDPVNPSATISSGGAKSEFAAAVESRAQA